MLFIAVSISTALSFLALNLNCCVTPLSALSISVGIKDGFLISLISSNNSLFYRNFTSYTIPKILVQNFIVILNFCFLLLYWIFRII